MRILIPGIVELERPEGVWQESDACSDVVSLESLPSREDVVGDGAGEDATRVEGLEPVDV